jgi:hypothetical protein
MQINVMGPTKETDKNAVAPSTSPILNLSPADLEKLAGSILVAVPHRAAEGIQFGLLTASGVWSRLATRVGGISDEFGGHIDITRAGISKMFLDVCRDVPTLEYLVMIDADESVEWDAPYLLARWGKPIVSGVVSSYSKSRGMYACFTMLDEYGVARFPSVNFTKKMPARGLIEVEACGTGLICIHKSVFEKFVQEGQLPFLIDEEERKSAARTGILKVGEDISFCRQAKALGFTVHVDLSVHAEHYKMVCVKWPEAAIDYEMEPGDFKVNIRDYSHG